MRHTNSPYPSSITHLRRRGSLEGSSHLRDPWKTEFTVELSSRWELVSSLQQNGAHDELVAHHLLVVIDVSGAVGTVVANDFVSC